LTPFGTAHIVQVDTKDEHQILLTLDQAPPTGVRDGVDAIENVTLTPEVEIKGCHVSRIPTRGFLLTSRRKTLVEDNTFTHLPDASILVADDANGWMESGVVRDVTIRGNHFIGDLGPVIQVAPGLRQLDPNNAVHENITITKNDFQVVRCPEIRISSLKGLNVTDNTFTKEPGANGSLLELSGCHQVSITGNEGMDRGAFISIHETKESEVNAQSEFRVSKE
jgi:hypothetical protein